ncbi:hypothetical protein SHJG_p1080 (plasmid) [Streptomyces hygroscopicus subsp. jinggangensis 5008]|nr:hypothetical protein SHJG_p1080 [Streptomyces hygroscopicus subsp. jinggangensis 5008]AGF68365.1 hypothetical protein SHJGH_p1080 [Streptomyces hygroscopicus subsp. jinggangensis TL01]
MTPSITASAPLEAHNEALLDRAAQLEADWYTGPRMWFGSSGEPVTGGQAATHLETALALLEREGWEPGAFGLREVLAGPTDVTGVCVSVLELVICAHTGASAAEPRLWDTAPARTVDQVRALLRAGAAYARLHGPTDAADH